MVDCSVFSLDDEMGESHFLSSDDLSSDDWFISKIKIKNKNVWKLRSDILFMF